jgi:hypothetical protein
MRLPVVMAAQSPPAEERARRLQLVATLAKPFPVDALLGVVATILQART